jgi:hypothetical protein
MSRLVPIDIRSPGFFWLVQPWKEGTLATIDGWGRFAEISFTGANRMTIRHLVNFPRGGQDRNLLTWPDAGLIASTSGKVHHLAAIDDNKTKSHVPLLSWVHRERHPVLFDPVEGLICYPYSWNLYDNDVDTQLFVYNYKEDRMVYESPEKGFNILPLFGMDNRNILSWERNPRENTFNNNSIIHNWRTKENITNDFTNAIDRSRIGLIIRHLFNLHLGGRFLFGYSNSISQRCKVTWNENYSDVTVTPLSYLLPAVGMDFDHFVFSANGIWASTFIIGYRGLRNERLSKRAFFHLNGRYPNGISMPVITEDYETWRWGDFGAFVNHPIHGLCFAQEWHKGRRQYLRLYKMSDVLAEINRRLLEAANSVIR